MTKRLLLSCLVLSHAHAQWEPLPPLPEPNGGFMCGVSKGKIVVAGGTNWAGGKKNWLKAVRVFDPVTNQWKTAKDLKTSLAYGAVFYDKDAFAFLGGFDGAAPAGKFGWGNTEQIDQHEDLNQPRSLVLAAAGAIGEWLIVSGGTDDPANLAGVTRVTYSFKWGKASPGLNVHSAEFGPFSSSSIPFGRSGSFQISRMSDYPGEPFAVAASTVVGDELFVFGGMNYNAKTQGPVNTAEAYAFSPAKNAWRKLQPLPAGSRGMSAVALDDRHIYLAGGFTEEFKTDALIYDVKTDSYQKGKPLPFAAMVTLIKLDGYVYCLGGEDKKQSRTDKFFRIPVAELLK